MSTPNNNEIIKEGTTSPWVTIEGTIMTNAKTGTKRLKLNGICYRQFKTRRFISGNSGFLPVISLNIYPEENYIEFSGISNQPNSPKETNDSELLSKFSGHNIYSLGSNENYDTDASNIYDNSYKEWVDSITYWSNTSLVEIDSNKNIAIVNGELEKAKNELKPIENEISRLEQILIPTNYDDDTSYKNEIAPLNGLKRESTNMRIKIKTLEPYLEYLKSSAYQERNKNISKSAQEYLDKVVNPDVTKIYINCIKLINKRCLYLMDINSTVSFSKYGLVQKDNANENSKSIIQQMKNIKIDSQSLNKVIQHYTKLKRANSKNNKGSQSTRFRLKNSGLNLDFGNLNINAFSGGRRKSTNKNPKYKRRKYSVKNKL
jgi:hypothetical protein